MPGRSRPSRLFATIGEDDVRSARKKLEAFCRAHLAGIRTFLLRRTETEGAICDSLKPLHLIVGSFPDPILITDPDGTILFLNRTVSGRPLAEVIGTRIYDHLDAEGERIVRPAFEAALRSGEASQVEVDWTEPDGTRHCFEGRIAPVLEGGRVRALTIVARDITARKEAETTLIAYQKRLRSLASRLSQVAEQERRSIAANLHDQIIQGLGLARLRLGELQESVADEATMARVEGIRTLLADLLVETRSVLYELSPPVLYELGLTPALEWLADRSRERHGVACRVRSRVREDPPEPIAVLLFHAARELLWNAIRHGDAARVRLELRQREDWFELTVKDNGKGFDPEALESQPSCEGGFGLFSLRERLETVGGRLEIRSAPGLGARVVVRLPSAGPEEHA